MIRQPPKNQHYKPSIFYLSLYLLVIIFSQLIISYAFHTQSTSFLKIPKLNTPAELRTYTNTLDGYTFQYPSSWKVSKSSSGVDVSEPGSTYLLNIKVIKNLPNPQKLISDWEKSTVYSVNSDSPIKIGPLKTLELLDSTSNPDHRQYLLYALNNKEVYEIIFLTDNPARTSTISKILSSINFFSPPVNSPSNSCVTTGCSNELCQSSPQPPRASVCIYNSAYACLKYAKCEVQSTGQCGWTYTEKYQSCLSTGPQL